jgi:D-alanyl-D-alanine carboxypeptidase (penicillin-binding protein 5/6)
MQKISVFFLLLFAFTQLAAAPVPAPPTVAATGYLLLDMDSGRVLAEKAADQRLEPASLTKIMTAHVVFTELKNGHLKPDELVRISKKAWKMPGSRMFVEVGKKVPVSALLKGMIIQSGNDASVALAEHIAGSETTFADLMNQHARELGMTNTHFANATGLPHEDHYTTPRDIAKVTMATIRDFPEYYKLYSHKEYRYNGIRQPNRNLLLWRDPSVDGVKTGHTESAGYCLVASAKQNGMRLISVVMGTGSEQARASASQALLHYGFRFYETHRLYGAGQALTKVRVWKSAPETVSAGLTHDLYVTIPRNEYDRLKARTEVRPRLMAPQAKGDEVGRLVVELGGETVTEVPLVTLQDAPEGGLWRRGVDTAKLWFE